MGQGGMNMRKTILFLTAVMVLSFLIPNLFLVSSDWSKASSYELNQKTSGDMSGEIESQKVGKTLISNANASYHVPETIKLLLTEKQKVIELPFEDYLKGVLTGEVPATYEIEALKAQAIVARTYTLYMLNKNPGKHSGADMCDDINCCQAYKTKEYAFASWDDAEENAKWDKLEKAVTSTVGRVITYQGELIAAFFHANSGGQTENIKYVWGEEEVPYLQSVSGNEKDILQDSKNFTYDEFATLMKEKVSELGTKESPAKIDIVDYTGSGRVYHVRIGGVSLKATELRKLLGIRSTNFRVEQRDDGTITFYTVGYGHGVGMSQEGANSMAQDGVTCEEILKHYYTGVEV